MAVRCKLFAAANLGGHYCIVCMRPTGGDEYPPGQTLMMLMNRSRDLDHEDCLYRCGPEGPWDAISSMILPGTFLRDIFG
jgi:hypothetical protein